MDKIRQRDVDHLELLRLEPYRRRVRILVIVFVVAVVVFTIFGG